MRIVAGRKAEGRRPDFGNLVQIIHGCIAAQSREGVARLHEHQVHRKTGGHRQVVDIFLPERVSVFFQGLVKPGLVGDSAQ